MSIYLSKQMMYSLDSRAHAVMLLYNAFLGVIFLEG